MAEETDMTPGEVMRDERGRFLPGTASPSPGRPRRQTEEQYLAALTANVTIEDWQAVVQKALTQAKAGDSRARNFLATWLLPERVDLTRFIDERQAHTFVANVLQIVVARCDVETARILREELSRQLESHGLA